MNKKYKIEVNVERKKDVYLSVTHNGYQWSSINIKEPEVEIPLIISALRRYIGLETPNPLSVRYRTSTLPRPQPKIFIADG